MKNAGHMLSSSGPSRLMALSVQEQQNNGRSALILHGFFHTNGGLKKMPLWLEQIRQSWIIHHLRPGTGREEIRSGCLLTRACVLKTASASLTATPEP